jgi:ubiquinone/menaquinone biosynthesis C-methylase UbiE
MDAVEMDFADHSFEQIICVEAAFYFNTRRQFLQEAWRVLKPGRNLNSLGSEFCHNGTFRRLDSSPSKHGQR